MKRCAALLRRIPLSDNFIALFACLAHQRWPRTLASARGRNAEHTYPKDDTSCHVDKEANDGSREQRSEVCGRIAIDPSAPRRCQLDRFYRTTHLTATPCNRLVGPSRVGARLKPARWRRRRRASRQQAQRPECARLPAPLAPRTRPCSQRRLSR